MLKQTLLFLSERNDLKNVLFKLPFASHMSGRFVAGDTSEEALDDRDEEERQQHREAQHDRRDEDVRADLDRKPSDESRQVRAGQAARRHLVEARDDGSDQRVVQVEPQEDDDRQCVVQERQAHAAFRDLESRVHASGVLLESSKLCRFDIRQAALQLSGWPARTVMA